LRKRGFAAYHPRRVSRPALLPALLVLVLAGLLGCGEAEKTSDTSSNSQVIARAVKASSGLGMHVTSTGTVKVAGQKLPISMRMSIAPSGRMKVHNVTNGIATDQYIDSHYMVMSIDTLPSTQGLPPGTRYIRMDLERIRQSEGIDSGLQDVQTMDPARVLTVFSHLKDVQNAGAGTVRGVPVTRYRATLSLGDIAKAIDKDGKVPNLPKAVRNSVIAMELSLDADDKLRGFAEQASIGAMKIDLKGEVTSFADDIVVDLPSGPDVHDITSGIVDSIGQLPR
jgi:hypothetical protein